MTARPSLSPDQIRVEPGDRPRRPDALTVSGPDAAMRRMGMQAAQLQRDVKERPQRVVMTTTIKTHDQGKGQNLVAGASQYISRSDAVPKIFGRAGPVVDLPEVRDDRDGSSRRMDALTSTQIRQWGADPRHWHIVLSPEQRMSADQLVRTTRAMMAQFTRSVGAAIEWRATAHFNTKQPHVHVLLRGRDPESGKPLWVGPKVLADAREAAQKEATRILGPAPERLAEQERQATQKQRERGVER